MTHFSSWRFWFSFKASASISIPLAEILFPLRLQNVIEQDMRGGSTNLFTLCVKDAHDLASFPGSFLSFALWHVKWQKAEYKPMNETPRQIILQVYIVLGSVLISISTGLGMTLQYLSKQQHEWHYSLQLSKTLVHLQRSSQCTHSLICDLVLTEAVEVQTTNKKKSSS